MKSGLESLHSDQNRMKDIILQTFLPINALLMHALMAFIGL